MKGTSISGLEEGYSCCAIRGMQVDVQELSPTNDICDITVSNTLRKIAQHECPVTLALVNWPGWGRLVGQTAARVSSGYATRCGAVLLRNVGISPIRRPLEIDLGIRPASRIVGWKVSWGAMRLVRSVLLLRVGRGGDCLDRRRGRSLFNRSIILAKKLFTISIQMSRLYDPGQGQ